MKELTEETGKEIVTIKAIYYLYYLLAAEKSLNLELPEWTHRYFPDGPMRDAVFFYYETMSYSDELKKFSGGMKQHHYLKIFIALQSNFLLGLPVRKVLNNFEKVIDPKQIKKPKIFLYGAHENNIAGILIALNLWKRRIPEYSSAVIFELHERNSEYFIKVSFYLRLHIKF